MFMSPLLTASLGALKMPLICAALIAVASFGFMIVGTIKNSATSDIIIDLQSQAMSEQQRAHEHITAVDDAVDNYQRKFDAEDFDLDEFNRLIDSIPEQGRDDKCHADSILVLPLPPSQ